MHTQQPISTTPSTWDFNTPQSSLTRGAIDYKRTAFEPFIFPSLSLSLTLPFFFLYTTTSKSQIWIILENACLSKLLLITIPLQNYHYHHPIHSRADHPHYHPTWSTWHAPLPPHQKEETASNCQCRLKREDTETSLPLPNTVPRRFVCPLAPMPWTPWLIYHVFIASQHEINDKQSIPINDKQLLPSKRIKQGQAGKRSVACHADEPAAAAKQCLLCLPTTSVPTTSPNIRILLSISSSS